MKKEAVHDFKYFIFLFENGFKDDDKIKTEHNSFSLPLPWWYMSVKGITLSNDEVRLN